jgi:hypothetical protein
MCVVLYKANKFRTTPFHVALYQCAQIICTALLRGVLSNDTICWQFCAFIQFGDKVVSQLAEQTSIPHINWICEFLCKSQHVWRHRHRSHGLSRRTAVLVHDFSVYRCIMGLLSFLREYTISGIIFEKYTIKRIFPSFNAHIHV